MTAFWRKLAASLRGFSFFAAKSERDFFALAITGMAFILPFTINNFVQGRHLIGVVTTGLVVWFLANGIAVYRGRRLMPPAFVFLPALAVLGFALWARGEVAIFWAYPAILLFHFILAQRVANFFNAAVVLMAVPAAYASFGQDIALRVAATLILTIVFANVFSYLIERQRRKEAEQAKFAADVFDSLPIGLAMRDLEGRYLFVNRAWESFTGARRADVIGRTVHDRAPKAEADAVVAEDRAVLARGPGAAPELQDFAFRGKRFMLTRTVMTNAQGATTGVLVASVDTTERHAMEQALAEQARFEERRLDLVVRAARVGIVDWDGRTHATYYSPRLRELRGYPPDADTSDWPDYFKVMIHPDDRQRVIARFRNYILGKERYGPQEYYAQEEYRLSRADGSYVWVQAMGICVRDESGFATRFIAVITDVTERRAQEEALRESVRLREDVERMSRHDLKTPLNSVIAMTRLLRENVRLPADDAELLGTIERAGYRILNMVNLSLDLFRMESGTYQFHPHAVDLVEVARKVAADLESQAASKGVDIRIGTEIPAMARADELLCYSMLANLVKNAIEAAPEGSAVSVSANRQEDWVVAKVHNPGAVPEAMRARFFQKYATAGKSAGLGLGTYSARLMARVQEGEITLQTSEAAGTSLVVRLKAAEGTEARAAPGDAAKDGAAERSGEALPALRVLVVDDDEFNRLVLRRSLPAPPLVLSMAVNGRAALQAAEREWPDVVLLDLEMPVMDGYQAARALRELERRESRKRLTIVAISSNDEAAIIERALAAGCDHYLVKPAPREALWDILLARKRDGTGIAAEPPSRAGDAVVADPDLEQAMPAFIESRRRLLEKMPAALKGKDRAAFKRLAHQLAGSFALYGFRWAAERCHEIEAAAPKGDAADLAARVAAVREHLDGVTIRYAAGAENP